MAQLQPVKLLQKLGMIQVCWQDEHTARSDSIEKATLDSMNRYPQTLDNQNKLRFLIEIALVTREL